MYFDSILIAIIYITFKVKFVLLQLLTMKENQKCLCYPHNIQSVKFLIQKTKMYGKFQKINVMKYTKNTAYKRFKQGL